MSWVLKSMKSWPLTFSDREKKGNRKRERAAERLKT